MQALVITQRSRNEREHGFSLVEMAIAVAVLGIITAGMIDSTTTQGANFKKQRITQTRMEFIQRSLKEYDLGNLYLPCPADASLLTTSTNFGRDLDSTAPTGARTCTGSYNLSNTGPTVVAGAVPVRTLQIPDEYAFDGWGRRFTYAVDIKATGQSTYASAGSDIKIRSSAAGADATLDPPPVAVLISHGPNGHGAAPGGGSSAANRTNTGSTDADERANSHLASNGESAFDSIFVKRGFNGSGFDDLVSYHVQQPRTKKEDGTCVAIGPGGTLAKSIDAGVSWTLVSLGNTADVGEVKYDPTADRWVIATNQGNPGSLSYSSDLTTWTKPDVKTSNWGCCIASDGTKWLLGDSLNGVVHSSNINTFITRTDIGFFLRRVGYANGLWIAAGDALKTSTNMTTWTTRNYQMGGSPIHGLAHNGWPAGSGSLWVAVGWNGKLSTSPDGITWTARATGLAADKVVTAVAHNGLPTGQGGFWVVGFTRDFWWDQGTFLTSPDGITWTQRAAPSSIGAPMSIKYFVKSDGSGQWITVTNAGEILTSANGISWTLQPTTPFAGLWMEGIDCKNAQPSDLWVIVGNNGKVATSSDGITWTRRNAGFGTTGTSSVAYHKKGGPSQTPLFVIVGDGKLAVSSNGVTWTQRTLPGPEVLTSITYDEDTSTWRASGAAMVKSTDGGITWTYDPTLYGSGFYTYFGGMWTQVAHNRKAGAAKLWIGGGSGVTGKSLDGSTWSFVDTQMLGAVYGSIYSDSNLWLVFGTESDISTSTDGITWTPRTSNFQQSDWNKVIYAGAYSNGLWILGGGNGKITKSSDGVTWVGSNISHFYPYDDIRAIEHNHKTGSEGLWIAAGASGILATSLDGTTWTAQNPGFGTDNIYGIVFATTK